MKDHLTVSKFTKFLRYWLKCKGIVHFSKVEILESLVWFGGQLSKTIQSSLIEVIFESPPLNSLSSNDAQI